MDFPFSISVLVPRGNVPALLDAEDRVNKLAVSLEAPPGCAVTLVAGEDLAHVLYADPQVLFALAVVYGGLVAVGAAWAAGLPPEAIALSFLKSKEAHT